jgi:hypothetical protein
LHVSRALIEQPLSLRDQRGHGLPEPLEHLAHHQQLRGVGQPFQGLVADKGGVGQRVLKGGQRGL